MTTELVSRADAGLVPPRSVSHNTAPDGLTAHYMGGSPWQGPNRSHDRCPTIWRGIQAGHMADPRAADIYYNSGVCPHGVRFEGRGPGVRTGANGTNDANYRSPAVCYLAGQGDELTDAAKRAFADEVARFDLPLVYVHRQWYATACPGDPLADWVAAGCPAPDTEDDDVTPEDREAIAERVVARLANPTTNPGTVVDPYLRDAVARNEARLVMLLARDPAVVELDPEDVAAAVAALPEQTARRTLELLGEKLG